jgi:hypothetical protein
VAGTRRASPARDDRQRRGARFDEGDPIVMTADEVRQLPGTVAVVHLEAINHCLEPRSAYRDFAIVPLDGEELDL